MMDGIPHSSIFWLDIFSVQESASCKMFSGLVLGRILLFLKKPICPSVNCAVLVALFVLPLTVIHFGLVYSPTLSR